MAKYVLLYTGGGMAETEAEQAAVMQAWGVWFHELGSALVDGGAPFSGAAKHISSAGKVQDGSAGMAATGYSIIEAASLDEATRLAGSNPLLQSNGQITVFETAQM